VNSAAPGLLRYQHRLFGRPVETWVARIGPGDDLPRPVLALLSAEERQQLASMVSPVIQRQYAAGRALTRLALSVRLSMPARRVPLSADEHGRPYLRPGQGGWYAGTGRSGIDFNLSHSGNVVGLAVCGGLRIGLDIERAERRPSAPALARRFFSPSECEMLERCEDGHYSRRWYRIWTTREAHAKARGIGVRAIGAVPGARGDGWDSRNVALAEGYIGTVVALRPGDTRPRHGAHTRGDDRRPRRGHPPGTGEPDD
jgi:4'-phosphopantetheinyl transferase